MIHLLAAVWTSIDYRVVGILKIAIACAGAVVLTWDIVARAAGRQARHQQIRDALLGLLGVIALLSWWNLGRLNFNGGYLHVHDVYHYYIGSKYFPELGYTGLYQCTAAADIEAGLQDQVQRRWTRDLATNELQIGDAVLASTAACKRRFSPGRWEMFARDVSWFRPRLANWNVIPIDHGYNATPVWAIAGHPLASAAPASDRQIVLLALLDPFLLLVMWGFLCWGFGWRTACAAALWWGTNYPARFLYIGGAFLRADWLMLSVAGICLVKRGHPGAGGFALAYAALLRIFPGFIIAGLVLKALLGLWRTRTVSLPPAHRSFALGSLAGVLVLVPLSALVVGGSFGNGAGAWTGFVTNSNKHLRTPASNVMGLKTVMAYEPETRLAMTQHFFDEVPWDTWAAARHRVFAERESLFWALVIAYVCLLGFAVRAEEDWAALVLGAGLIPVAAEIGCYYYGILLVYPFLRTLRVWIAPALCVLSALTWLFAGIGKMEDDVYVAASVAVLVFVVAVTAHVAFGASQRFSKRSALPSPISALL
jgi:hypothetical protein